MKVSIICESCGQVALGPIETSDPEEIGLLLLAVHGTPGHTSIHPLRTVVEDASFTRRWKVRLVCVGCSKEETVTTPPELAAGACIAFHSAHEGHFMEIHLDDGSGEERRIYPP